MRSLVQHGREAKELTVQRLVDNYLLLVFVHGRHADRAGDQDISASTGVAHLVNALTGGETADVHLPGEHARFVIIQ